MKEPNQHMWHELTTLRQARKDWSAANARFAQVVDSFWRSDVDHHAVLRECDRTLVLELLSRLGPGKRPEFLNELMALATSYHGERDKALSLLLDLPRDFLLDHIEEATDVVLSNPDANDTEYLCLLEICEEIQANAMITKLMSKMAQDPNLNRVLEAIRSAKE